MDTPVVEDDARICRVMSSDVASATDAKEFDITREEEMFGESMSSSSSPIEDDEDDDEKAPQLTIVVGHTIVVAVTGKKSCLLLLTHTYDTP